MPEPTEVNKILQGRTILSVEPGSTPGWMLINLELNPEEHEAEPGLRLFLTIFIGGRKGSEQDNDHCTAALHFKRADGPSTAYMVRDGRDPEMPMSSAHAAFGGASIGSEETFKTTSRDEPRDKET